MGNEFGPSPEEIVTSISNEKSERGVDAVSKPEEKNIEPVKNQKVEDLPSNIQIAEKKVVDQKTQEVREKLKNEIKNNELVEKTNFLTKSLEINLKVLSASLNLIKRHPQLTGVLVSTALGTLSMISQTPIPPEILTKLAAGVGGATLGYSQAPEGASKKSLYSLGGALAASGMVEGAGHVMNESTASVAANFLDDIPVAVSGAYPAIKKASEVGGKIIENKKK